MESPRVATEESAPTEAPTPNPDSWRPRFLALAPGVFAAFTVENYRERVEQERRARLIYSTVREEIDVIMQVTRYSDSVLTVGFAEFDSAYARGERPLPYYFRYSGSERPYSDAWQAAMSAQAAQFLDPRPLASISRFYGEQLGTSDRFVRYATFTEAEVLPFLSVGPDYFYQPGTTRLKPIYGGHMDRLRELKKYWADEIPTAADLLAAIDSALAR